MGRGAGADSGRQRDTGNHRRDDADVPAEGLRLWAPWRYAYLRSLLSDPNACIFCFGELSDAERRQRLVLFENRDVLVMLNKYPYSNGHIMVAPRSHVASLEMLTRSDRAVLGDAVAASIKLMRGERIEIRGFGSFAVKQRRARQGRNPKTGQLVSVDAKQIPFFRAGKELRIEVNGAEEAAR